MMDVCAACSCMREADRAWLLGRACACAASIVSAGLSPVLHAGPDNIFVRTADAVEHAQEQQLTADKAARPAITAL